MVIEMAAQTMGEMLARVTTNYYRWSVNQKTIRHTWSVTMAKVGLYNTRNRRGDEVFVRSYREGRDDGVMVIYSTIA